MSPAAATAPRVALRTPPLLLLLLLLLGALWGCCPPAASVPVGSDPPTSCCFSYTATKIPRSYVVDYYETNNRCSQPAVVFITRKRREVCADPTEPWVQEYTKGLQQAQKDRPGGPGQRG